MHLVRHPAALWQRLILITALGTACALPAPSAASEQPQYQFNGSYSIRGPNDERADGSVNSNQGGVGYGGANGSMSNVLIEAGLQPLAYTQVTLNNQGPLSSASGNMTLSYSAVYTPSTLASLNLVSLWASSGQAAGWVSGWSFVEASGRAFSAIRATSRAGGFGAGEAPGSATFNRQCGQPFADVGPSNNSQCGGTSFILPLYFTNLPDTSSFVASIILFSRAGSSGALGQARAFVDPLITLDARLEGELVVGGGLVANAVPEPRSALLMLAGVTALATRLRRRRATQG